MMVFPVPVRLHGWVRWNLQMESSLLWEVRSLAESPSSSTPVIASSDANHEGVCAHSTVSGYSCIGEDLIKRAEDLRTELGWGSWASSRIICPTTPWSRGLIPLPTDWWIAGIRLGTERFLQNTVWTSSERLRWVLLEDLRIEPEPLGMRLLSTTAPAGLRWTPAKCLTKRRMVESRIPSKCLERQCMKVSCHSGVIRCLMLLRDRPSTYRLRS